MPDPAVEIDHLSHRYGERAALDDVSLRIARGEIFGFLGPNGSGKTTLFRILCTLVPPTSGRVSVLGHDVVTNRDEVRKHIGVVFQSPALDEQLSAKENLLHHGHLYGLRGAELRRRVDEMLSAVGLADRARERVIGFSGGMRRRVELAKGLLHRPDILLLDEPSTGLDPGARIDLWRQLHAARDVSGVTILVTTHLMDEAEHCNRLTILDAGKVVACDAPAALRERVGGDVISLTTTEPAALLAGLRDKFGIEAGVMGNTLRVERPRGHEMVPELIEAFPGKVDSVSVGKPTLEDVFIHLVGRSLTEDPRGGASSRGPTAGSKPTIAT
ncbi:MAG: ATP-binding cassette domain-containing protein [Tepidisphaeraceae bacterium]